jgi:hypothetical protein
MSEIKPSQSHQETPKEIPEVEVDKTYMIQGVKFRQTELTISEDIKIIKLFKSGLGVGTESESTMLDALTDMSTLESFFKVILKGEHDQINVKQIKNSELEEVMGDFFLLNKSMIQKFMSLGLYFQNPQTQMNLEK